MSYVIRIDIEASKEILRQTSQDDCWRPVDAAILFESDDPAKAQAYWENLESLFPNTDYDGIKTERKNRTIYTVFVFKDEEDEGEDWKCEELDMAKFTSLKPAKELMNEIVSSK